MSATPTICKGVTAHRRPRIKARHRVAFGLAAEPAEVGRARRVVRGRLEVWRLHAVADAVVLVLGELAGNALRHAPCPVIEVVVTVGRGDVLIEVRDGSAERPVIRTGAGPYAEGGRGLPLVAALSRAWGCVPGSNGTKTTWALVPTTATTEGPA